jgi:diadenylate cyclase
MGVLPTWVRWQDVVDIALVAFLVYRMFVLIRGTRAVPALVGLAILIIAYAGSNFLGLFTVHWLLSSFLSSIVLVVIILFQSEIRRALAHVGMNPLRAYRDFSSTDPHILEEILKAVVGLAHKKVGALVVIQRETELRDHIEEGFPIDAQLSKELIECIFLPYSPIHDGAVVVKGARILLAGCFLPLSTRQGLDKELGTRHRAALGLSEETDAVVLVISEEKGTISLVSNGRISRGLDGSALRKALFRLFHAPSADPEKYPGQGHPGEEAR